MAGSGDSLSLTEQAVVSLQEMIALSGARPGDRFGNEADLERKLGVSRVVVREAVSRLRALGMLESRQGLGLIIGKPDPFGASPASNKGEVRLGVAIDDRYAIRVGRNLDGRIDDVRFIQLAQHLARFRLDLGLFARNVGDDIIDGVEGGHAGIARAR